MATSTTRSTLVRTLRVALQRACWLLACGMSLLATSSCSVIVNAEEREACTSTTECTERFGEPSACVNSECKKLLTAECTEVWPAGALSKDNVMLIGFVGALTGDFASYGTPTKEGAELALHEIEGRSGGLGPPTDSNIGQRHLAMLVCDHGTDPVGVARHLIENANVPVIIGDSFSTPTLDIFANAAKPAGVLVLSPSATSPALTDFPDNGLLWRTSPSDVVQAETLKFLLVDVVDALHETGVLAPGKAAKIAMPNKDDSAGGGLAKAATSLNQDSPTPAPVVKPDLADQYPDPDKHPVNWQEHIDNITNASPNIILAMGTGEFVSDMMQGIEDNWNLARPRPWYLLPEGDRVTELKVLVAEAKNLRTSLNDRILGTAPGARRSSLYDSFAASFQALFKNRDPGNLAEFGYDAGYLVAYAIAIANKASPSGRELATALQHVSCKEGGTTVSVGPAMFSRYFGIAANGGCIDFEGASGPLDFNPDTGEALSDIATWCMRPNGDGTFGFEPPLTGFYSVKEGRMKDDNPPDLTQRGWCAQQ